MKYYIIYKTTNIINNNYYIGMHQTPNKDDGYLGSGLLLKRAIKKHGRENFKKEILFELKNKQQMVDKEKELVTNKETNDPNCYNIKLGGEGGFDHITLEVTRKALQKLWSNEEFKNKMKPIQSNNMTKSISLLWTNPLFKLQMKEKSSTHMINMWSNEEFKNKMKPIQSNNMKKLHEDPKFKQTISNANKLLWENEEYRVRKSKSVSETNIRLWQDEEYRQKRSVQMSESRKGRKYIHNDSSKKIKVVHPHELQSYLNLGWVMGFKHYE